MTVIQAMVPLNINLVCPTTFRDVSRVCDLLKKWVSNALVKPQICIYNCLNRCSYPETSTNMPNEVASLLRSIWADVGIQYCAARSHEYSIPNSATYFLNDLERITQRDYIPSFEDILRCRIQTTGVVEMSFQLRVRRFYNYVADIGLPQMLIYRAKPLKWPMLAGKARAERNGFIASTTSVLSFSSQLSLITIWTWKNVLRSTGLKNPWRFSDASFSVQNWLTHPNSCFWTRQTFSKKTSKSTTSRWPNTFLNTRVPRGTQSQQERVFWANSKRFTPARRTTSTPSCITTLPVQPIRKTSKLSFGSRPMPSSSNP